MPPLTNTCAQLARFQNARIVVEPAANTGFGASFLKLLAQARVWADLVMFSDQDDVWLEDKIKRVWSHLTPLGELPGLYWWMSWWSVRLARARR